MSMLFLLAQSGTLNPNFGTGGIVKTVPGSNVAGSTLFAATRACFTQGNGKILTLVDLSSAVVVSRRLANGRPDSSYGVNGFSVPAAIGNAVGLLEPDGKMVVAGLTLNSPQDFIIARYNTNGSLDASFGSNGVTVTDAGSSSDAITALAMQADGKIIGGGMSFRNGTSVFALIRYTTAGKPDPTFGAAGIVITAFDNTASISGVAVQTDGKIAAAGDYNNGNGNFAVARYKTNGALDTSFDHTGTLVFSSGNNDNITSLALQAGRILVGGYFYDPSGDSHFEIARVTSAGGVDASFGQGGFTTTAFGNSIELLEALAVEPNGSIIGAGYTEPPTGVAVFAMARFTTAGSVDSSFGVDGQVVTMISDTSTDFLSCISIAPGGQILSGGSSFPLSTFFNSFSLVRYTANGALDSSFAQGGILVADYPAQNIDYNQVFMEPDGKLLVPGTNTQGENSQNFISRFTAKGLADASYGQHGTAATLGFYNIMQPDGKMVESGNTTINGTASLLLARYKINGNLDSSFGTNGTTAINFFGESEFGAFMALQPDQKIIATGFISNDGTNDLLLARFTANGAVDPSFGNGGAVAAGFELFNNAQSIAVAASGKILVAGAGFSPSFQLIAYLARFNANGSVDSSFGQNGFLLISSGVESFTGTVIPLSSGKILFAYENSTDFNSFNSFITRYNANGSADSSFGVYGTIAVPGSSILLEPDQKIIAYGHARDLQGNEEFVISRYLSNGKSDLGFGTRGSTETNLLPIFDNMTAAVVTGTNLALAGFAEDPNNVGLLAEYTLGPQLSTGTSSITLPTDPGGCTATLKDLAGKIVTPDGVIPTITGATTGRFSGSLAEFPFNKGETRMVFSPEADSATRQEFVINVVDREAPMISAITNTLPDRPDADGGVTLQVVYSATDNCGPVQTNISTDGEAAPVNSNTIRVKPDGAPLIILLVRATDQSGNQSEKLDSVVIPESLFVSLTGLVVTAAPNPAAGEFVLHVRASNESFPVFLELYGASGTSVQSPRQTMAGQTVHMGAGLPAGTYFLKARQGNTIRMVRLVKR
jgi:uncharacterized delta-60 repeat protein